MRFVGNGAWREALTHSQLKPHEQAVQKPGGSFVRYRGKLYNLRKFVAVGSMPQFVVKAVDGTEWTDFHRITNERGLVACYDGNGKVKVASYYR